MGGGTCLEGPHAFVESVVFSGEIWLSGLLLLPKSAPSDGSSGIGRTPSEMMHVEELMIAAAKEEWPAPFGDQLPLGCKGRSTLAGDSLIEAVPNADGLGSGAGLRCKG